VSNGRNRKTEDPVVAVLRGRYFRYDGKAHDDIVIIIIVVIMLSRAYNTVARRAGAKRAGPKSVRTNTTRSAASCN